MRQALLLFLFIITTSLSAQSLLDTKLSIDFKNQTIINCITQIEQKSSVSFSYNLEVIQSEEKKITQSFSRTSIRTILTNIFMQTPLAFKEIGDQITVYKRQASKEMVSFSGYIVNSESKEKLIGAQLFFPELEIGTVSNAYGYFVVQLPIGVHNYQVTSMGMISLQDTLVVKNKVKQNLQLVEDNFLLTEIVVKSNLDSIDLIHNQESSFEKLVIGPNEILQLPSANGLPDITKNLQQISGVQPTLDGTSSFQVRSLSSGNNLILIDEIPIYHPNHLLGLYSIINSNAVKSTSFYKDYIPAKFGSRNSSVLNIYTKEGDLNKFHIAGGVGASVPHLDIEGPIVKNKASFFISVRKSNDALSSVNFNPRSKLPAPDFFDLTFKVNSKIDNNNRVYLTSYIGQDKIKDTLGDYKWGNKAFSFRWNSVISEKTFANMTVIHSAFTYKLDNTNNGADLGQKVLSDQVKYDLTQFISNKSKLNIGFSILNTRTQGDDQTTETFFVKRNSLETAFYGIYHKKMSKQFRIEAGLRIPLYFNIGTNDTTLFLRPDFSYNQVVYRKNKLYDFKLSFDPRVLLSYTLNSKNKLEFAAIVNTQFTHIINYNTNVLPIEIWTTSSYFLKPERNFQSSVGLTHYEKNIQSSVTIFGRHVQNVIDYATTVYSSNLNFESNLLSGNLNVAGVEFMTHVQKGDNYTASLAYSYNHSLQKIEGINNNKSYVPLNYRPHYLALNQHYTLSKRWEFGANFVIHSPTAITLPTGKIEINGVEYPIYDGTKNSSFLPKHHRLDLSVKWTLGIKKQKNRGYLMFTLTNIYGRENISTTYLSPSNLNSNNLDFKTQNYIPASIFIYYYIRF